MCEGCGRFFKNKHGIIKAAAMKHASRFVEYVDLAQIVYLKILEWKQGQDRPDEVANNFLYTIASNAATDVYRKRKREYQPDSNEHLYIFENVVNPNSESDPEVRTLVRELLEVLPDEREKDAVFSWYNDEAVEVFARRHNVSLNHASVLRSRAIEKLRACMAKVKEIQ